MHLPQALTNVINKTTHPRSEEVRLLCLRAKELEESGDYEQAVQTLDDIWEGLGERPDTNGILPWAAAELLLRAGALSGYIGSARQIEGAQEFAKDLITESIEIFDRLDDAEKSAEAKIDLAICYWRQGGFDEARLTLQNVIARFPSDSSEQRARALLNMAIIAIAKHKMSEAVSLLSQAQSFYLTFGSLAALGRFQMNHALALKELGLAEKDEVCLLKSISEHKAAIASLTDAGHFRYAARTENNLGFLLFELGKYDEAEMHLDRARNIFVELNESGNIAQVNETRAKVFIAQHRYDAAERLVSNSIYILEQGDEKSLLSEALITRAIALSRLKLYESAKNDLNRAVEVSEMAGDTEMAGVGRLVMLEELSERLSDEERVSLYLNACALLKETQNSRLLQRVCVQSAAIIGRLNVTPDQVSLKDMLMGGTLNDEMNRYEKELYRRALFEGQGSVTQTAKLLGIDHQRASAALRGRFASLLSPEMKTRKKRERSIITK